MTRPITLVYSLAASLSLFGSPTAAQDTDWQHVTATREGLVGGLTASGHRIAPSDWFVALPSRTALHRRVRVCHATRCITAEALDVGPWNTRDPYWQTARRPHAESGRDTRGRRTNGAGIDLADGVSEALRCGDRCQVSWRFDDRHRVD